MRKFVFGIALLFLCVTPAFAEFGELPNVVLENSEVVLNVENDCEEQLVLGYFFQNKGESAIVTRDGSILLNPNHTMEIFAETSCQVSEVMIGKGDDFVNLYYDDATSLWFGTIPESFLKEKVNPLVVVAAEFTFDLPEILNARFLGEDVKISPNKYEIYHFNGYLWEEIEYSLDEVVYPVFTLSSGRYYARLKDENRWFYSPIVDLDESSMVAFSRHANNFPIFFGWLERYFSPLELEFFNSGYLMEEFQSEYVVSDFPELGNFINLEEDALFVYMNRWNPLYVEYLEMFELLSDDYEIVLFTSENSFSSLQESLKTYDVKIGLYTIEGSFLESLLAEQPKVYFYESDVEEIIGFSRTRDLNLLK